MKRIALTCCLAFGIGLLVPNQTSAFCGFYVAGADAKLFNDATIVVLMRDGTRTVLSMQNAYQGPPEDFALVIPVPVVLHEGDVKILRDELFDRVETLASPRLVEYWERDPCEPEGTIGLGNLGLIGKGSGSGTGVGFGGGGGTVKVEAQFEVGEYEIVILSATESSGLDQWLRDNQYNIPEGAEPLLRPYVQQEMKFFVAKVDPKKVKFGENGRTMLSPLRFHYDSKDFVLPVRLGLINAPDPATGGKQDLLIHILAPGQRYAAANHRNVTIPTNLDLKDEAKQKFGEFYVSLFDQTLEQNPGAVVTEYSWGASACDPCPGPDAALTQQELLELGGDVLPGWTDDLSVMSVGSNVSQVSQGQATVDGDLDKDIVRRIVRAHINEVRFCYNQGLTKNTSLAGSVAIDFTITGDGKVDAAKVAATSLSDTKVGECIAKAVKRWTFPKPGDGGSVTVSYPFTLAPPGAGGAVRAAPNSFVLTRLHARYDATSLGEDLVFEAAPPIEGGREVYGEDGALERGATVLEGGFNNFQARYAIRHPWTGEIACKEPIRGRWGGPPEGTSDQPMVAKQLTQVARGASLGSFVTAGASEQLATVPLAIPGPGPSDAKVEPAAQPTPKAATTEAPKAPPAPPKGACTCSSEPEPHAPAASLAVLALLGLRRARTRRLGC